MNTKDYTKNKSVNMSRIALGVFHGKLIRDRDDVLNIYQARPLRHWEPTIPLETRLKMLKLRSDAWKKQKESEL